jgi:DNA replication protein DnaC
MRTEPSTAEVSEKIALHFRAFRLPFLAAQSAKRLHEIGGLKALQCLLELLNGEQDERALRRNERFLRASNLPADKSMDTLVASKMPRRVLDVVRELATGAFLEHGENALFYGLPGRGKTHAAAALGRLLIAIGYSVLFTPTFRLVQELLAAKRDLTLPKALRKLDAFELIILDDIGYVQQSADEVEVLFTLLSERYERRSVLVTSNLAFSEWDKIFKNPMTTAAAIDRFVHHCTIVDFNGKSVRAEDAKARQRAAKESEIVLPDSQAESPC